MKKILFALLAFASFAPAATIQTGKGFNVGMNVQLEDGTPVAGGYSIRIGYFAADPTPQVGRLLSEVLASFTEFASTTSPTSGANAGLIVSDTASNALTATPGAAAAAILNGKIAYMLISSGDQYGVLKGAAPTATSWTFPTDVTSSSSVNVVAGNVAAVIPVIGSEIDSASGPDTLRLFNPVPEPGVSILALAGLGLLARRRRN